MSDEDMVAYLVALPARPRDAARSIETLLHAFVPAPHVHHTHPDGINVLAGTRRRRAARARSASATPPPGSPTSAPASRSPSRSARRSRDNPDLKLVVLAKHGLVVWGDSAEEAYRHDDRGHQPGGRVRQRAHRRHAALRRRAGGRRRRAAGAAARAAAGDPRRGLERAREGADRRHVASARWSSSPRADAEQLVTVGAPCPDHLVHTKRAAAVDPVRPRRTTPTRCAERIAERAERVPRRLPRVLRGARGDGDRAGDPDPRVVLVQHLGLVAAGADDQGRRSSRATSTTARSR